MYYWRWFWPRNHQTTLVHPIIIIISLSWAIITCPACIMMKESWSYIPICACHESNNWRNTKNKMTMMRWRLPPPKHHHHYHRHHHRQTILLPPPMNRHQHLPTKRLEHNVRIYWRVTSISNPMIRPIDYWPLVIWIVMIPPIRLHHQLLQQHRRIARIRSGKNGNHDKWKPSDRPMPSMPPPRRRRRRRTRPPHRIIRPERENRILPIFHKWVTLPLLIHWIIYSYLRIMMMMIMKMVIALWFEMYCHCRTVMR